MHATPKKLSFLGLALVVLVALSVAAGNMHKSTAAPSSLSTVKDNNSNLRVIDSESAGGLQPSNAQGTAVNPQQPQDSSQGSTSTNQSSSQPSAAATYSADPTQTTYPVPVPKPTPNPEPPIIYPKCNSCIPKADTVCPLYACHACGGPMDGIMTCAELDGSN